MTFAEKVERLCRSKGESPSKACVNMGLSNAAFTHWKKDGNTPYPATVKRVADYFGVSVDYFYKDEEVDAQTIESAKVAVFGADVEVTDEEWDEIRQYAQFIKQRKAAKKVEGDQKK